MKIQLVHTITLNHGLQLAEAVQEAIEANLNGADALLIYDSSDTDAEHDGNIGAIKKMADAIDIPMLIGGGVRRLEDVKKYLYAGAKMAVLDLAKPSNADLVKEAVSRFGSDKIAVESAGPLPQEAYQTVKEEGAGLLIGSAAMLGNPAELPVLVRNVTEIGWFAKTDLNGVYGVNITGLCGGTGAARLKHQLAAQGVPVFAFTANYQWADFKLNSDGLLPVIVQDYRTNEVLMLAYMNEEAFLHTMETGRMTYYSRSRQELWEKGLTSGHFQYVKEMSMDCDMDTMLAKVYQVGAACHTGKRSCFFNTLAKKEYTERNPLKVFEEVFQTILDRKEHPKEGSYTNYLFDKGIDKILKKVGEEATEIVIAAKNPDPEEIKYEISDFLYHVMVLMAERGVTWEEITTELARR